MNRFDTATNVYPLAGGHEVPSTHKPFQQIGPLRPARAQTSYRSRLPWQFSSICSARTCTPSGRPLLPAGGTAVEQGGIVVGQRPPVPVHAHAEQRRRDNVDIVYITATWLRGESCGWLLCGMRSAVTASVRKMCHDRIMPAESRRWPKINLNLFYMCTLQRFGYTFTLPRTAGDRKGGEGGWVRHTCTCIGCSTKAFKLRADIGRSHCRVHSRPRCRARQHRSLRHRSLR